jgi:phospholipase/carboxylesterase
VPQGLAPYQSGYSWFPIRVRSQDPERISQGMRRAATRLAQLLAELGQRHPTKGKPLVTGFSQGGMLSFALAVDHPQSIAAAIPMAGWLPPPMWPSALPPMAPPIVALHGDGDQLLEIEPTRAAVGKLRQLGFQVELHEYPGVGHTVSPAMRRELYRQLAAQVAAQVAGQSSP